MIPRDSVDYYPTPDSLAFDLAYSALPSNEWGRVNRVKTGKYKDRRTNNP